MVVQPVGLYLALPLPARRPRSSQQSSRTCLLGKRERPQLLQALSGVNHCDAGSLPLSLP